MNTKTRSLVIMNYFPDNPDFAQACKHNSAPLISMLNTCYEASGKRWPNFIAVDFYKVSLIFMVIYKLKLGVLRKFCPRGVEIMSLSK